MEENTAKALDKAFNDMRRKIDFIAKSCEWQNTIISQMYSELQKDTDNGSEKCQDRDD